MEKLVRPYLDDILEAIAAIEAAIGGKSLDQYSNDLMLRRAIERFIEIISEASRRIPKPLRDSQPQIPWPRILGIGNVLRHEYQRIANQAIYETAVDHIPALKAAIIAIEKNLDEPRE